MLQCEFMRALREGRWAPLQLCVVALFGLLMLLVQHEEALAEDESFTPRLDGDVGPVRKASPTPIVEYPVTSFLPYHAVFKVLCERMELDGRRARLVSIAEVASQEQNRSCSSCQILWQTLYSACRTKASSQKRGRAKDEEREQESSAPDKPQDGASPSEDGESGEEAAPPAVPTAIVLERFPSIDVIEAASAISNRLYGEAHKSNGHRRAVQGVEKRFMATRDLTAGERDYFSTLFEYLLSAWQGRPTPVPVDPKHWG